MQTLLQQATLTEYEGGRDFAGLCHGQGRAVFTSGQVYEGQWQNGHMQGDGSVQFPDGISYTGSFQADAISGSGVYCWQGASYEGEVSGGLRHGYGRLTISGSPVVYEGQWQQGKRCGRGVLYYNSDKTAYYEGDWLDDMKHGQGTSVYPSGNTYSGSWMHDQRQGQGSMVWATKAQRYTGHWVQGLPDGFGEHVWEQQRPALGLQGANHAVHVMHNRYVGMFKEGQRHGQGALFYSSGACYEGQWQQGKKHGQGVYVFEDGHVFSGQFMDDRPVLATGAVLGVDSTFTAQEAAWGSCLGLGASSKRSNSKQQQQQQQELAAEPGEALQGLQARSSSNASGGEPVPTAGVAAASSSEPQSSPAAAVASKGASKSGKQLVKAASATSAVKPASATSKAAPNNKSGTGKLSATIAASAGATTAAPAKRASSAASAASAGSAATGKPSTADSQAAGGSAVSTSSGPCFGPATCVMQLYIADLLQCYEGQPEAVYKPVSNLLVGYNTELRLLYDKYSACPSPLLDAGSQAFSWALQACQLWELLQDAQLLCRHLNLQQVCSMVSTATRPPPAVLRHRQQVEPSSAPAAPPLLHAAVSANTQLLFRDFCEVLVRVAAARYPLLPSLDAQLQQVITLHLLPLLGASARQLTGSSRASMLGVAAVSSAVLSSEDGMGLEQQLRSPEVVQYLQDHSELLQQLYVAIAAAGRPEGAACEDASTAACSAAPAAELEQGSAAAELCLTACQQDTVSVWQVVACLQSGGVLEHCQLSVEAAAACLLHNTLHVTDPQGARACIEDAASEAPDATDHACSSNGTATAAAGASLMFYMDVPLLLQEVLWGLGRLAAAAHLPQPRTAPAASTARGTAAVAAAAPSEQRSATGRGGEDWEPCLLLPRLQALLEGPGGVFEGVLGWAPEPQENAAGQAAAHVSTTPSRQGSEGLGALPVESGELGEQEDQEEGDADVLGEQGADETPGGMDGVDETCQDNEAGV